MLCRRNNVDNKVRILAVVVSGVCCLVVATSLHTYHQTVLAKQFYECIASGHTAGLFKQPLDYQIQFRTAKTGIVFTVFPYLLYDKWLDCIFRKLLTIPFVVGLSAVTKQPAESAQTIFWTFPA